MGKRDRAIEDDIYILYEEGVGVKKIGIQDIKKMVTEGKFGSLMSNPNKCKVYRMGEEVKPEYREGLAQYIVSQCKRPKEIEFMLNIEQPTLGKLLESQ